MLFRAILWKEVREQALIVASLTVLGGGLLAAAGILNSSGSGKSLSDWSALSDPGVLGLVMLLLACGVVVGAALFAGEKESGTESYLQMLPAARWKVWAGKYSVGAILVLGVAAVLFGTAAAVNVIGPTAALPQWGIVTAVLALSALGWGAMGSTVGRTALAACGFGLVFALLIAAAAYPFCWFALAAYSAIPIPDHVDVVRYGPVLCLIGTVFATLVIPAVISWRNFTRADRDRKQRVVLRRRGADLVPQAVRPNTFGNILAAPWRWFAPAVWLAWRQHWVAYAILAPIGIGTGCLFLIPVVPASAVWPCVFLLLGCVAGVVAWSDEQSREARRFWVERRIPLRRVWWGKLLVGLPPLLLTCLLAAVPAVIGTNRFPQMDFLTPREFPILTYLFLWPVYGYVLGHLCGMLFDKTIVAVAVAILIGGSLSAAWLPSLLSGGVHEWMAFVPPLLVLVLSRRLVWPWAAGQLGQPRALVRLAVGGAAVVGSVAAAIGYRVWEVPDVAERSADLEFRRSVPPFETNDAGRGIRSAGASLAALRRYGSSSGLSTSNALHAGFGNNPEAQIPRAGHELTVQLVLDHGWQPDRPEFEKWLDGLFVRPRVNPENPEASLPWYEMLHDAVRKPLGVVEDPNDLTPSTPLQHLDGLVGADRLLLVRALRKQYDGDPAAFVPAFETVLALSRQIRHKSIPTCDLVGQTMEQNAYRGLDRWLERLDDRDDLLVKALAVVAEHDRLAVFPRSDVWLAQQTMLRNTFNFGSVHVARSWGWTGDQAPADFDLRRRADIAMDLIGFAWQVPWEAERHDRLVGLGNAGPYPIPTHRLFRGLPADSYLYLSPDWTKPTADSSTIGERRAAQLNLAIRRYQLANGGRPPLSLVELAPKFVPQLPTDPLTKAPFDYTLSRGEYVPRMVQTEPLPGGQFSPEAAAAVAGALSMPPTAAEEDFAAAGLSPAYSPGIGMTYLYAPRGTPILGRSIRTGVPIVGTSTVNANRKNYILLNRTSPVPPPPPLPPPEPQPEEFPP